MQATIEVAPVWLGAAGPDDPVDELIEAVMGLIQLTKSRDTWGGSGLSRVQVSILAALARCSPRRVTSLAADLSSDLSVLSRQCGALIEAGMVDRERDPADGRAWLVSLTAAGAETLLALRQGRLAWFKAILADVEPEDLAQVTAIVRRIVEAWDGVGVASAQDQTK
jgi:DNA-binding MarR family transcriptional regulator